MRWLTLIAVMPFFHSFAFASANCEGILRHAFTQGTLRLLEQRVLTVDELSAMLNSDAPVNPVRNRRPGGMGRVAVGFFSAWIPLIDRETWYRIREELRAGLNGADDKLRLVHAARVDTAPVLKIKQERVQEIGDAQLLDWRSTERDLYLAFEKKNSVFVSSPGRSTPIWTGERKPGKTFRLKYEENGRVTGNYYSPLHYDAAGNRLENVVQKESVDLRTGQVLKTKLMTEKNRSFDEADGLVRRRVRGDYFLGEFHYQEIIDGKWNDLNSEPVAFKTDGRRAMTVSGLLRKNGQVVIVGTDADVAQRSGTFHIATPRIEEAIQDQVLKSHSPEVRAVKAFETSAGRLLVGVLSSEQFEIFEPETSEDPILSYQISVRPMFFDFNFVERSGLVLVIGIATRAVEGSSLMVFDPAHPAGPLERVRIPDAKKHIVNEQLDGQVLVHIFGEGKLITYSLFNMVRP